MQEETSSPRQGRPADPDLAAAMDELDEFLATGKNTEREPEREQAGPRAGGAGPRPRAAPRPGVPEDVLKAYRALGLGPEATMEQVRAAYRKLMRTYHPDKHTDDAEKQRVATEITQRLTEAFVKIREFRSGRTR